MDDKKIDYLSDEELERLISDTENGQLLKAPNYLKNEIMMQIKTELPVEPIQINKLVKRKLRIYQMKVVAVAAAAIFALFLIPAGQNGNLDVNRVTQSAESRKQNSVTQTLNDRTNSICNTLFDFSNKIISPQKKAKN